MSLKQGDLVLVKPGEVIPADGVLVDGETETDETLLTGESRPVVKRAGAGLAAGAVNRLSPAVMRVEQVGEATRASHIRRLTERAAGQRPHLAEITDRIAGWFVAGVLAVAAATALFWAATDAARALWITVAVLVVTCPCALSLATPTALAVSVGNLARRGVIATRGHAIEALVARDPCGIRQDRNAHAGAAHAGGLRAVRGLRPASTHWLWPPRWSMDRSIPSRARFRRSPRKRVARRSWPRRCARSQGRVWRGASTVLSTASAQRSSYRRWQGQPPSAGSQRGYAGMARQRAGLAGGVQLDRRVASRGGTGGRGLAGGGQADRDLEW